MYKSTPFICAQLLLFLSSLKEFGLAKICPRAIPFTVPKEQYINLHGEHLF